MKNFEERLKRLEELSELIRDPELGLEEGIKIFEEGIKLSKSLEKDLGKIEARVEILLNEPLKDNEKPQFGLFDSADEGL